MLRFVSDGGVFMMGVLLLGLAALIFNILNVLEPEKNYTPLVFSLSLGAFFLGLCGTGVGLYQAGVVMTQMTPTLQLKVMGIASTCTAMGALLVTINAVFWGVSQRPVRSSTQATSRS